MGALSTAVDAVAAVVVVVVVGLLVSRRDGAETEGSPPYRGVAWHGESFARRSRSLPVPSSSSFSFSSFDQRRQSRRANPARATAGISPGRRPRRAGKIGVVLIVHRPEHVAVVIVIVIAAASVAGQGSASEGAEEKAWSLL